MGGDTLHLHPVKFSFRGNSIADLTGQVIAAKKKSTGFIQACQLRPIYSIYSWVLVSLPWLREKAWWANEET